MTIESVWTNIKNYILDIKGIDISNPEIMFPKLVDSFRTKSSAFLSIGHFFSKDLCADIEELRKKIDENTIKARNKISTSMRGTKEIVNEMSNLDKRLQSEITDKLMDIEDQIQKLIN